MARRRLCVPQASGSMPLMLMVDGAATPWEAGLSDTLDDVAIACIVHASRTSRYEQGFRVTDVDFIELHGGTRIDGFNFQPGERLWVLPAVDDGETED